MYLWLLGVFLLEFKVMRFSWWFFSSDFNYALQIVSIGCVFISLSRELRFEHSI
jgi:hypothetical protein